MTCLHRPVDVFRFVRFEHSESARRATRHAKLEDTCLAYWRACQAAARGRQLERSPGVLNAYLRPSALPECCQPDRNGQKLLDTAFERLGLTVRAVEIILRVARSVADLAESQEVRATHVAGAIQYRCLSERDRRQRNRG